MSDLKEELACLAHTQWAGWMRYLFKLSNNKLDGSVIIPAKLVERWRRQICTPYNELSEPEKDSDRKEADKFIEIFEHFISIKDSPRLQNYVNKSITTSELPETSVNINYVNHGPLFSDDDWYTFYCSNCGHQVTKTTTRCEICKSLIRV